MPGYTKFYVLNAGTVAPQFDFTPWSAGSWLTGGNFSVLMDGAKFGSQNNQATRAETSATNPYDLGVIRAVSRKLLAQSISGTVDIVLGVSEANLAADFFTRLHLYVYNATDDVVLGTLVSYAESAGAGDTEWTTTSTGVAFTSAQTLAGVTVPSDGKDYYLVAELGVRGYNSSTGTHTARMRFGAMDSTLTPVADLTAGSTSTSTLAGFLQFSNPITVEASIGDTLLTAGRILIPGADQALNGGPEVAVILDAATAAIVGYWHEFPTAETGDNLPDGTYAVTAQALPGGNVTAIKLFDVDNQPVATVAVSTLAAGTWGAFSPLRSDQDDTFYVLRIASSSPTTLHAIASDGTVLGSWTMPSSAGRGCSAMCPARDGSKVYFGFRTSDEFCNGIGRFDLAGAGSELTALIPTAAGLSLGRDLLVTADGDVLVTVLSGLSDTEIRRYADDGTLLATYALPTGSRVGDNVELSQNPLDPTSFYVRTYPSSSQSLLKRIRISDGVELMSEPMTLNDGANQTYIPTSCPFIIAPFSLDTSEVIGPIAWVHTYRVQP